MTARRTISAFLLMAACAIAEAPAADAGALVDGLRSADWQARQRAEDGLVALGVDAIPTIEAALAKDGVDLESRERLQSALARIAQERLLLATRVTAAEAFESPYAAFAFLAEQVGVPLESENQQIAERARTATSIKLDHDDVAWLAALDDLTARTGIAAEVEDGRLRLLAQAPDSLRPPTDYTGSAAVIATGARRRETLQLGDDNRRGDVFLSLAVDLEPKATLVEQTARLVIRKITNETDQVIREDQLLALVRRNSNRYYANLTLGTPGKAPQAIGTIEGELQGEIVTRVEDVRITDLTTLPRTVPFPDGEVEIAGVETDEKGSELVLLVPAFMNALPIGQMLSRSQIEGLRVLDQDGQPMRYNRTARKQQSGMTEYRFTLTGNTPADTPATISWTIPTQTRDIRIPFKLSNLPMPE